MQFFAISIVVDKLAHAVVSIIEVFDFEVIDMRRNSILTPDLMVE